MSHIIKDAQGITKIVSLSPDEEKRWRKEFGKIRKAEQYAPAKYIDIAVEQLGGHKALAAEVVNTTALIFKIRETAWEIYIEHEQMVSGKALHGLMKNNETTRSSLRELIENDPLAKISGAKTEEEILDTLAYIVGNVSGRTFPYQYELAKSVTQSRRSRAGKAFERVIRHIIDIKGFPCDDQSKAGTDMFQTMGLGKIVDGLIPGFAQYQTSRAQCAVLTMKTTLRERWQEVVEEQQRTNIPHIYLLTLDNDIPESKLATMKSHNITVVAPLSVQKNQASITNLISFEQLFNHNLPHLLQWWEGKMPA